MKKILLLLTFLLVFSSCSRSITNDEINTWTDTIKSENEKIILSLWDSLTAWYWLPEEENYPTKLEKTLKENWYNYKIINAWVSWDTSENVKSRAELYLEKKPEIVILVIWWNDWLRWLSLEDLKQNILDIIDLYENAWVKVVLSWMDIPANLWIIYRNEFKNIYPEVASERDKIYFQDFFLDGVAWNKDLNIDDMIHPNWKWYDIIVENLFNFLENNKIITK